MPTAAEHPGLLFLMARSNTFRLRAACSAVVVADAVPDARVDTPVEVSTVTAVREQEHSSSTVTTAGTIRMRSRFSEIEDELLGFRAGYAQAY